MKINKLIKTNLSRFNKLIFMFFYGVIAIAIIVIGSLLISNFTYSEFPSGHPIIATKFNYFAEHKQEYNVIFLGSSRTYRQIIPSLFDQSMGEKGYKIKSFNFGIPSLYLPEAHFYLQRILELKPNNVKWIFVEYIDRITVVPEHKHTEREKYWHTPKQTFLLSQAVWNSSSNLLNKLEIIYRHLSVSVHRMFRTGKGVKLIDVIIHGNRLSQKTNIERSLLGDLYDGYFPLDDEKSDNMKQRRVKFLDNLDQYNIAVESLSLERKNYQPSKIKPSYFPLWIAQKIEFFQANPIFIVPPSRSFRKDLIDMKQNEYISTLFDFNDPINYPDLYKTDYRFDKGHLNEKGAKIYTELIANKFETYLKSQH